MAEIILSALILLSVALVFSGLGGFALMTLMYGPAAFAGLASLVWLLQSGANFLVALIAGAIVYFAAQRLTLALMRLALRAGYLAWVDLTDRLKVSGNR